MGGGIFFLTNVKELKAWNTRNLNESLDSSLYDFRADI